MMYIQFIGSWGWALYELSSDMYRIRWVCQPDMPYNGHLDSWEDYEWSTGDDQANILTEDEVSGLIFSELL